MKLSKSTIALALVCIVAWPALWSTPLHAAQDKVTVPQAAHRALSKAHGLMGKKDYAGAAKALETFRARKPKWLKPGGRDPEGYLHYLVDFNLANTYLALNRLDDAVAHYETALAARPNFSPAWMNLAKAFYDAGKHRRAAESFIKGYETSEAKQPATLYYAAVSYLTADDHARALKILLRLFAEYPDDIKTEWREQLVQAHLALKQPRKALPHIEILAKTTQGKRQRQWQAVLFYQYRTLKMEKSALKYARFLVRIYPTDPKWWKAMASLHLEQNHPKEALAALMIHNYLTDPAPAPDYRLLGDLSLSLGVPEQASRYYQQVVARRKKQSDYKRWIQSHVRRYQPEEALAVANEALKQFDDPDIRMLKGEVLYDLEKYDQAASAFSAVVEKKPDTGRAWLMMGYAAWQTGHYASAKTALARAADFPDQKQAAQRLLALLPLNRQQ